MLKLAAILLFVSAASAHVCMLSPPQRGSMMGINKPGADDCNLESGPCGGRKMGTSALGIKAGSKFLVAFQKNLDHYVKATPGYFNVSVSFDDQKTFAHLMMMPDNADPSLTLYYKNVTMPSSPTGKMGTLQLQYVTKNPEAPAVFYQCSDVMLYK